MVNLETFFYNQLETWELARNNYACLASAVKRKIAFETYNIYIQFNPARIKSTGAKTDAQSIAARPCFLCAANRPAEQEFIQWRDYEILVNPFPIFSPHFTVANKNHVKQALRPYLKDMLDLAKEIPNYAVFYNGPSCGASAPDHAHFQIIKAAELPLIEECMNQTPANYHRQVIHLHGEEITLPDWLDKEDNFNAVCVYQNAENHLFIIPRKAPRPAQYFAQGDEQILVSPATVEMCGVIITPREVDFNKITKEDIISIYSQTAL